ncbi:FGGY family carbohydrate kinase [Microbispora sp. ZYX-F-249]|uniref:FGGY family carbohydrate kinase n=1 Tax=Microbispora maris TaxID=3144104 RepID=A0ABV0ATX7_9ACTN
MLAIDQGTSGTKAVVVDGDGAVRAPAEAPVRPAYLPGGRAEQDPRELLGSVLAAGREAVGRRGGVRRRGSGGGGWPAKVVSAPSRS